MALERESDFSVNRAILNYPPAIRLSVALGRIGRADAYDKHE